MISDTQAFNYLKIRVDAWATSTLYKVGDNVNSSGTVYECLIDHTSGVFATDLAALKWTTDSMVNKSVNAAIADVISYCNRDFRTAAYTEKKKAVTSNKFFVSNYPINATDGKVTVLQYLDESTGDWEDIIDGTDDTIDNSTYRNSYEIRLLKGYTFPKDAEIKVTYENLMTGWAGLDKVEIACLELMKLTYDNGFHSRLGKSSENLGGASDSGSGLDFKSAREVILSKLDEFRNWNI